MPNIYRRSENEIHTAGDGQKFEGHADSLNANHSFKYFGKGQGISAYTFVDERNLFWHPLVFSATERESAYVIDGLMRNDAAKSDIHSTDTHGFFGAIFAVTHLLGVSFAPRIKNLKKQTLDMRQTDQVADMDQLAQASERDGAHQRCQPQDDIRPRLAQHVKLVASGMNLDIAQAGAVEADPAELPAVDQHRDVTPWSASRSAPTICRLRNPPPLAMSLAAGIQSMAKTWMLSRGLIFSFHIN